MELSAELFVLDNLLMDLLMLRLAAAIGALRLRPVAAVLAAFLGAVYALLSMSALPLLAAPVPKLLLCAAASLPLVSAPRPPRCCRARCGPFSARCAAAAAACACASCSTTGRWS